MSGYSFVDVGSLEGEGPGGSVRKARRAVGARAFGFNYFILPPNQSGREHSHEDSNQEEVYFVVHGSGTMRIGDGGANDGYVSPDYYVYMQFLTYRLRHGPLATAERKTSTVPSR